MNDTALGASSSASALGAVSHSTIVPVPPAVACHAPSMPDSSSDLLAPPSTTSLSSASSTSVTGVAAASSASIASSPSPAPAGDPSPSASSKSKSLKVYSVDRVIGKGRFGVVYAATNTETGEAVAIKRVFQDRRYKDRELQIMSMLHHPNVIRLKHCFYSKEDAEQNENGTYLYICMDLMNSTGQLSKTLSCDVSCRDTKWRNLSLT